MRHNEKSENIAQGRRSLVIASQAVGVVAVYHTSLFSGICREIRTKFHQQFAKKMQNSMQKIKKSEIHYSFAKKC